MGKPNSQQEMQIANKLIKKYSSLLIIKERK